MKEASEEMMDMILRELPGCPERDMEQYVRNKIIKFNKDEHGAGEKYDFLVEVSEMPVSKLNDRVCVGDISTFIRELCAMSKHYKRPD